MVNFWQVSSFEVQSTPLAASRLPLEEWCYPRRQFWVVTHAGCPRDPIAIVRTAPACHFDVSFDRCFIVAGESQPRRCGEVPRSLFNMPILPGDPVQVFPAMSTTCPGGEFQVQHVVCLCDCPATADRSVLVGPSLDHRIQVLAQSDLGCCFVAAYYVLEGSQVLADLRFAGRDDRFEAKRSSSGTASGVRFAHPDVTHGQSEEVKSHVAMVVVECMRDRRLAWFQFSSYASQPCDSKFLGVLDD